MEMLAQFGPIGSLFKKRGRRDLVLESQPHFGAKGPGEVASRPAALTAGV